MTKIEKFPVAKVSEWVKVGRRVVHTISGEKFVISQVERAWEGARWGENTARIQVRDARGGVLWTSELYLAPDSRGEDF